MIKSISRSGHVITQKENSYVVEGQLPADQLEALFLWVESLESKDEIADKLIRDNASDQQAVCFIEKFQPWTHSLPDGQKYEVGDRRRDMNDDGELRLYKCEISHFPQADWKPCRVNMWRDLIGEIPSEGGYPTWSIDGRYSFGQKVWHKGILYESTHPGHETNVAWEPGVVDSRIWKVVEQ